MVMALKPIYDLARIKRIIVSTYQAASGAGKDGLDELENQIKQVAWGEEMTAKIFPSASAKKHFRWLSTWCPRSISSWTTCIRRKK